MPRDSHNDTSRDTVSLTYQELADRLGIDVQSARCRVLRAGWAKVPGNDGRARVNVPVTVLPAAPATAAVVFAPAVAPAAPPPSAAVLATPEAVSHLLSQVAEMGELRDRLGRAEAETAALREVLTHERDRAHRAGAEASALRERAGWAEGKSLALREQAKAERERAEAARWVGGLDGRRAAGAGVAGLREPAAAAVTEAEAKGLRLALEEARRPFWRRWLG